MMKTILVKEFNKKYEKEIKSTRLVSGTSDFIAPHTTILHEVPTLQDPLVKVTAKNGSVVCFLIPNKQALLNQEVCNQITSVQGVNYLSKPISKDTATTPPVIEHCLHHKPERAVSKKESCLIQEQKFIKMRIQHLNNLLNEKATALLGEPITKENKALAKSLVDNTPEAIEVQSLLIEQRKELEDFIRMYHYNPHDYLIVETTMAY